MAGALSIAAGAAVIAFLDTPMQVVAPLRAMLAAIGAVVALLGGLAWLAKSFRIATVFGSAGAIFLALAILLTAIAPRCEAFAVANGDARLAGTVCLPGAAGAAPTAIFVHGSGREPRDEFRHYAETLAKQGVAAVIYDKRGAGKSTGETFAVGYEGYAADLVAVAEWARERPFSRDDAVGFIGYSEAEWVMPLAARQFAPAFIVVVGASALSPSSQVSEEMALRLRSAGFDEGAVAGALSVNRQFGDYVAGRVSAEAFGRTLGAAKREPWFTAAEDLPDKVYGREEYAWWSRVLDFDPRAAWDGYRGPILFLKGTADDRSDARLAADRFRRMLPHGARLTTRLVEGADHALLLWPLGKGRPPPAFAPGYPRVLGEWILEQAGPPGR